MRILAVACVAALGCGVPAGVVTPKTAAHLEVHAVDWNPRHEHVDAVTGSLDFGSDVVVFTRSGTAVIADGLVNVQQDDLRRGGVIPAPDGSGSWITGIDSHGRVWRLRARRSFEPVSDRFGLEGKDVRALAGFGGRYVAFVVGDRDVAVADGTSVVHFELSGIQSLTAGGVRAWATRAHDLVAIDPRTGSSRSYLLESPHVAVDAQGRVFVASGSVIYEEGPSGKLTLRYVSSATVRSLVASNDHVWFTDGDELGVIGGDAVARTHGAHVASGTTLQGSLSGDVWSLDPRGALSRFGMGAPAANASHGSWEEVVAPVFARACASCHAPDGSSGVDLSTKTAWRTKRDLLRQRLVTDHDMPPKGHALSDSDRETLATFLSAAPVH